ncbi:MAG: DVUA0089 family protein [Candidatus Acidiferrales bacterium]
MRFARTTLVAVGLLVFLAGSAMADSTSYTGTLANSTDSYALVFNVGGTSSENVTIQTWGFGGGVNAAGQTIAAGGFDPFVGIFSGTGGTATMVTDGLGDPYGTSDALSNFGAFVGCPPAGTVNIGGSVCGDLTMQLALLPGTYTLLLSDALFVPNAVFDNGTLDEGFSDFTGGAFQTCNTDSSGATTCATDTANWAFDLTTSGGGTVPTPEPGSLFLLAGGLCAVEFWRRRRERVASQVRN